MATTTLAGSGTAHDERTATIGMVIFMGSWAMLFASLFFAYGALRVRAPEWPPSDLPRLPLVLPSLATLALALASGVLQRAYAGARIGRPAAGAVAAAALLGSTFLTLQIVVWRDAYLAGLRPAAGTYPSVFFGLTVFHGLHVVVGLLALAYLALRSATTAARPNAALALRLWTLYWHMVGVIWGVMFLLVYVM